MSKNETLGIFDQNEIALPETLQKHYNYSKPKPEDLTDQARLSKI